MKNLLARIIDQAQKNRQRIAFAETDDPRTLQAIDYLDDHKIVTPILIGNKEKIGALAKEHGIKMALNDLEIFDPEAPENQEKIETYITTLFEKRKEKGMTRDQASELMKNHDYIGCMMTHFDEVDGLVSGANSHSADFLIPVFHVIGVKEKFHKVSGVFFMLIRGRLMLFADCSVMINPDSKDLANIALDTAKTARRFGIEPRVAMLSYSTHGASDDPLATKVAEAVKFIQEQDPLLIVDGEIQLDAAIVPEVAEKKFPNSPLKGNANVLIFPDLNSGNIGYKLCERLAGADAIGPILQGLKKPVNDLSRGCSWMDIVHVAAVTACEAMSAEYDTQEYQ